MVFLKSFSNFKNNHYDVTETGALYVLDRKEIWRATKRVIQIFNA
jgi:hypothetical protein